MEKNLSNAANVTNASSHLAIREIMKEGILMKNHINAIFAQKVITGDIC